ncbi:MAG: hypothetical protein HOY79_49910 [Streptomyces sp.]|nr:hypothetical protein [Streptomyces sp.]
MRTDENAGTTTIDALALLELPALEGLTTEQVRGAACIWRGEPLTTDTAVDLGERRHKRLDGRYSTFPRACHRCTHEAAYAVLIKHTMACEQCVDNAAECPTGRALLRLMRENRR